MSDTFLILRLLFVQPLGDLGCREAAVAGGAAVWTGHPDVTVGVVSRIESLDVGKHPLCQAIGQRHHEVHVIKSNCAAIAIGK